MSNADLGKNASDRLKQGVEYVQKLKPNEIIFLASIVIYASGFIVSSIFLGSLGVLNVDILRIRYISIGLVFFLFIASFMWPLNGIFDFLGQRYGQHPLKLIGAIIGRTYDRYGLVVLLLVIGGGAINISPLPVGLPQVSPSRSLPDWFETEARSSLLASINYLRIAGLTFLGIYIFIMIFAVIKGPGKSSVDFTSRWDMIVRGNKKMLSYLFPWRFPFAALALLVLMLSIYALAFVSTSPIDRINPFLGSSIGRFLLVSFLFYLLILVFIFIPFVMITPDDVQSTRKDTSLVPALVFLAIIVVPIYALSVYPALPQHIGGGRPVPVQLELRGEGITEAPGMTGAVYLLDRSSDAYLFLLPAKLETDYVIIEIPVQSINSIVYTSGSRMTHAVLTPSGPDPSPRKGRAWFSL